MHVYTLFSLATVPPHPHPLPTAATTTDTLLRYAETLLYEMRPSRTTTRPLRANARARVFLYSMLLLCVLHCNRRDHGRACSERVYNMVFADVCRTECARD